MAGLPIVGVVAAVQGMASFTANANTFNQAINNMVRTANLLTKAFSSTKGSDAAVKNAARVQLANDKLAKVQAQVAADVTKAQNNITKVTTAATQANVRAAQLTTNAQTRAAQATAKVAQVQQSSALTISRAQQQQAASAQRLSIAQNLAANAYTPARAAAAQRAAIAATSAQQRLTQVTQRGAANIAAAQASAAAATTRAAAAGSNAAATWSAGLSRVMGSHSAAAGVVANGAARMAAATSTAAASVGTAMTGMGLAAMAAAAVVAVAFVLMAKAAFDFMSQLLQDSAAYQHQMNALGAIAGETGEDVTRLSTAQLNMARTSSLNATQLSVMTTEMTKAGLGIDAVIDKALAVGNAMVVASNGELQAEQAATLLQVAFAGFGAVAVEAGRLTDQMDILPQAADAITAAVQKSTLTFTGFSDAMRQGGGTAARMGYTIQEFTALVGAMGLTIKSGSEIGTGLRMMFQNLQAPSAKALDVMREYNLSMYDSQGAIRPARDLIVDLSAKFDDAAVAAGKLTQLQRDQALATLFGGRAAKSVAALLNAGVEKYDEMYAAVSKTGTAQEAANRVMQSSVSIITKLKNTWDALKLSFGEGMEPFVNSLIQSLDKLAQAFAPTNEQAKALGETIGGILFNALSATGEVIGFVASTIGALFSVFGAFIEMVITVGTAVGTFVQSVRASMQALWNIVVAAFSGILEAGVQLIGGINAITLAILTGISGLAGGFYKAAMGVGEAFGAMVASSGESGEGIGKNLNFLATGFNAFLSGIAGIPTGFGNAFGPLAGIVGRAFSAVMANVNKFLDSLAGVPLVGELVGGARAAVGGFVTGFSTAVGAAGAAVVKFASVAVAAVKSIKLPNFRDYAGEVLASFRAAQAGVKKIASGGIPASDTDAYDYPEGPGKEPKGGGGGGDGAGDKAAKDYANALKKAQELLRDFFDDVNNMWRDHANKIGEAFEKAGLAMAEAVTEAEAEIAEAILDANDEILKLDTDRNIERDVERRKQALDDELDYAQVKREQALEDEELIYDRALEDLELIEQKKREAIERTFDKAQERAAQNREDERADQDRDYDRQAEQRQKSLDKQQQLVEDNLDKQQDAEERSLNARQTLIQDALDREQDARQKALDARLEAEEKAMKASQDARMTALEAELAGEKRARTYQQQLSEIDTKDLAARTKAQQEYAEEIRIGVKRSIADARLKEKIDTTAGETATAKGELSSQQAEDSAELSFEAAQQKRIADLQAQFDAENAAREASADAQKLALKTELEAQLAAMKAVFAAEDLALKTLHETQIDQLHEAHERARDDLSNRIENDRLNRQKDRAREDREFAEKQEAAKQKFIEEQNALQLIATRKLEDEARLRKGVQDAAAILQSKKDEQAKADLTETLDNEDYARNITQINDERDKRVAAAHEALRLQQIAITEQLAREQEDLRKQLEEKITTIKTQYIDKMQELLEEGGENMKPIIDNIGVQMEDAFNGANTQVEELLLTLQDALKKAEDLTKAINNMPKAPTNSGSTGGGTKPAAADPWAEKNYQDNLAKAAAGNKGKQYGGVVQGPYGSSQLVEAHGGEFFAGMGGYGSAVAAVRQAESMAQRGMGGSTTNTNNYSYNVNANYGRTQAEGSVRLDLSALVALTSK